MQINAQKWRPWKTHHIRAQYAARTNFWTFKEDRTVDNVPIVVTAISTTRHKNSLLTITYMPNIVDIESTNSNTSSVTAYTIPYENSRARFFIYNIILNNGIIFSNCSYNKRTAFYAIAAQPKGQWTLIDEIDFDQVLHYAGIVVDGSEWDLNLYWAELSGILAAIEFTNDLCAKANVTSGQCTVYCDGKGALSAAFGNKMPTPKWSSYDLVLKIRISIRASPIHWKSAHVKGRQGKCTTRANWAHHPSNMDPGNGGQPISRDLPTRVWYNVFWPLMEDKLCHTIGVSPENKHHCNLDIFFQSISSPQPYQLLFNLIKFNAHLLPVGNNMVRRKHAQQGTCPGCGQFEDHEHILMCKNNLMTDTYAWRACNRYHGWIIEHHNACYSTIDSHTFNAFRSDQPINANSPVLPPLEATQYTLGRKAFFAGICHNDWITSQEVFYQQTKNRQSASRWLIHLIHKIPCIPLQQMWTTWKDILHKEVQNVSIQA